VHACHHGIFICPVVWCICYMPTSGKSNIRQTSRSFTTIYYLCWLHISCCLTFNVVVIYLLSSMPTTGTRLVPLNPCVQFDTGTCKLITRSLGMDSNFDIVSISVRNYSFNLSKLSAVILVAVVPLRFTKPILVINLWPILCSGQDIPHSLVIH